MTTGAELTDTQSTALQMAKAILGDGMPVKAPTRDAAMRVCGGRDVDYVHLLVDHHQLVFSKGLATDTFFPGPHVTSRLEQAIVDEICATFPALNPRNGAGYGSAARCASKDHAAQVLPVAGRAA